jgi:hypothetical protein
MSCWRLRERSKALSKASIQPEVPPRLPFMLPEFTRVSWVNDNARNAWEPRLARVNHAWRRMEWASAASCVRRCALLWLTPSDQAAQVEQWRRHRLSALSLPEFSRISGNAQEDSLHQPVGRAERLTITVVGRQLDDVHAFRAAWQRQDHDAIGCMLGYPHCCCLMFAAFWSTGATDPTWTMACATEGVQRSEHSITVSGNDNANILWRWLGIRAVAHLPCSFGCTETTQIGESMMQIGQEAGLAQEVAWLRECLTWPVEYSALHGIAEIKTPILRVIAQTDATAEKLVVKRRGSGFPQDGARGLNFPYRAPVSVSLRRHKATLPEPGSSSVTKTEWYFRDNGFNSLEAMTKAHRPLVEVARRVLAEQPGNILDLGSGNGALLAAICARCPSIRPLGVEINAEAVEHAPAVLRELPKAQASVAEVLQGDLFDAAKWQDRDYVLAILMLGRLAERQKDAEAFLQALSQRCSMLLVYLYPDWAHASLTDLAAANGLALHSEQQVCISGVQACVAQLATRSIVHSGVTTTISPS